MGAREGAGVEIPDEVFADLTLGKQGTMECGLQARMGRADAQQGDAESTFARLFHGGLSPLFGRPAAPGEHAAPAPSFRLCGDLSA